MDIDGIVQEPAPPYSRNDPFPPPEGPPPAYQHPPSYEDVVGQGGGDSLVAQQDVVGQGSSISLVDQLENVGRGMGPMIDASLTPNNTVMSLLVDEQPDAGTLGRLRKAYARAKNWITHRKAQFAYLYSLFSVYLYKFFVSRYYFFEGAPRWWPPAHGAVALARDDQRVGERHIVNRCAVRAEHKLRARGSFPVVASHRRTERTPEFEKISVSDSTPPPRPRRLHPPTRRRSRPRRPLRDLLPHPARLHPSRCTTTPRSSPPLDTWGVAYELDVLADAIADMRSGNTPVALVLRIPIHPVALTEAVLFFAAAPAPSTSSSRPSPSSSAAPAPSTCVKPLRLARAVFTHPLAVEVVLDALYYPILHDYILEIAVLGVSSCVAGLAEVCALAALLLAVDCRTFLAAILCVMVETSPADALNLRLLILTIYLLLLPATWILILYSAML
ncbi:hypothetical protein K438DRAFT_1783116 [Mycena galopus ATCC 62051]|nr:hypothetical protein K438DRAFT_1783116 [Mycena galopus ATCC 62051]